MEDLMTRLQLTALQDSYTAAIDNDRIEDWPGFFVEDGHYEIISSENEALGLPAPVVYCDSAAMMRDRVVALRHANIYEKPFYRHCLSGMQWHQEPDGSYRVKTSYVVINTSEEGTSSVYQAGLYDDHVVQTPGGLRFRAKRCVYDTLRVQTLLAFPI